MAGLYFPGHFYLHQTTPIGGGSNGVYNSSKRKWMPIYDQAGVFLQWRDLSWNHRKLWWLQPHTAKRIWLVLHGMSGPGAKMEKRQLQSGVACYHDNHAEKAKDQSAQSIQTRPALTQFSVMTNPAHFASRVFLCLTFAGLWRKAWPEIAFGKILPLT